MILPDGPTCAGAGLSPEAQARKRKAFARCAAALGLDGDTACLALSVPGRIEVLGKHTDYAGGRSLLCAVEWGFSIVARPRRDSSITIGAAGSDERCVLALDPGIEPRLGHWTNYPATVARRVARNFPGARLGADIVFDSDLPPASGLSSSSAFMIGVFAVLATVNRLDEDAGYYAEVADRLSMAAYVATIENGRRFGSLAGDRGVGTFGGSEDHTAILCCRPGRLARYAFGPPRFEEDVPLPHGWVFVVGSSGVVAEKTGAARELYNRAARLAADALSTWNGATGRQDASLEAAASSAAGARDRLMDVLRRTRAERWSPEMLVARASQFCLESLELVPDATAAMRDGDMNRFGELVDRSQRAAEEWLDNQVPETVFLARSARESGAAASSAFGAGFGGSVWALVREGQADAFIDDWRSRYAAAFPVPASRAAFLITRPGPAAFALSSLAA